MKLKHILMVGLLPMAGIFTACEKDDPAVEKTEVSEMAGEWYVKYEVADASGKFVDLPTDGRGLFATTDTCTRIIEEAPSGYLKVMTSSTAENNGNTMWIGDLFGNPRAYNLGAKYSFWSYQVRANVDLGSLTFSANDKSIGIRNAVAAIDSTFGPIPTGDTVSTRGPLICPIIPAIPRTVEDFQVTITDGKIIKDGSTPPSGTTTDSIHYIIKFGNDTNNRTYRVSGYRRTGFAEDDPE